MPSDLYDIPLNFDLTTSVRPTKGIQPIRRSFIRAVSLGRIMAEACRARKGKVTSDR